MKKYILFIFLCLAGTAFGQITLSWPVDRAVFQRNNSGTASIIIAGQAPPVAWVSTWQLQYQIETLNKFGNFVSISTSWTNIPTPGLGKVFRVVRSAQPTGWYRLTVRLVNNGTQVIGTNTVKFGVGEVFVIAGQSNAAGEGPANYASADNNGANYDCIITSQQPNKCTGFLPLYPVFGALSKTTGNITPNGFEPWAYNMLATNIIDGNPGTTIPVMIFNTGLAGTSSEDWSVSASNPTISRSTNFSLDRCTQGGSGQGQGEPFRSLRNSLNYFGSLFGTRGVIWHQGETDTYLLINGIPTTDYTNNLNNVIQQSRNLFNSNLAWAVSSVSRLNSTTTNATVITKQNASRTAKGPATSNGTANSDNYHNGVNTDYRQSDNLHFQALGLKSIATDYRTDFVNVLSTKTPVLANPIVPVTFTQVGATKVLTLNFAAIGKTAANFNCFFWTQGNEYTAVTYPSYGCSSTDTHTKTISSNGQWRCYMRENGTGNIYMTQRLTVNMSASVRIAATETEEESIETKVYPNPTYEGFENTIEFNIKESSYVKLEIIDKNGRVIKNLTENIHDAGKYKYPFTLNDNDFSSVELYYYRLTVGDQAITKRILLK